MARTRRGKPLKKLIDGTKTNRKVEVKPDYEKEYDSLDTDILGQDNDSDDGEYDYEKEKEREARNNRDDDDGEEEESEPAYMFFDFRRGRSAWPENVEYVDPKRADELLEKATASAAEEAAKTQKKEGEEEAKGDGTKKSTGTGTGTGKKSYSYSANADVEETRTYEAPPENCFEVLKDGSTALVIKPGHRLKLNLQGLLEGGDANKVEREKKIEKEKKLYAKYGIKWTPDHKYSDNDKDDDYGYSSKWFKEYINEYTITIDLKVKEMPPREGLSLYQTALIHADSNKRTGKTTLSKSDGECIVNAAGGVGIFGTFGDTTKARVEVDAWKRVVVSCKCVESKTEKGEMRTWIGTEPGIVVKEDNFSSNDRFAIDPAAFYLFSSGQSAMMPGKILVRAIRVESKFSTDLDVRQNQARDKILSFFTEERKKEADKQREGLSLAALFPKPRPMWIAPAFVALFGDAFVEKSTLEGSSNLPWSFTVINHALQNLLNQNLILSEGFGLPYTARVGLADTLHIMNQSAVVFKSYLRMLKTPNDSQLMSFLKKLKKLLASVTVGESLILPTYVQGREMILYLERVSDRSFRAIIIQTNPTDGLRNHAVTTAEAFPLISYRTCLVLDNIPKKNVLDDVFWMALYHMSIHSHDGDMTRFYDVLIPFLTGKPLESSLVESEKAMQDFNEGISKANNIFTQCGAWRFPQRSNTAYVRCIIECLYYIYRRRGLTDFQANQIHLALALQMIYMLKNDLMFMLPDENGVRVSLLALRELSSMAVNLVDQHSTSFAEVKLDVNALLQEVHGVVESVTTSLNYCKTDETAMPPDIDLAGPETKSSEDPALTQYKDSLSWDISDSDPDPGQSVSLRKYIPVDYLQVPKRAKTRTEAITAIRMCDKLCTLTKNQNHCIKNDCFLILALIEHVFTQVVPIPKPRGVDLIADDLYIAERTKRRAEKKKAEEAVKAEEKKKIEELNQKNKGKSKKKDASTDATTAPAPKVTFFGEEELPDFEEGYGVETELHQQKCIWDQPITYELQVELLLTLQRLMELLAMAGLSIQQSRSLDATIIIVAGCIAAISDAIIRKEAIDEPSEFCCHLLGRTREGRQLGHPGFGISVGTFATQCETLEIHSPELNVAKTGVLDYFLSPNQRRLDKIFSWEEDYNNKPGKNLIKFVRMVCREIGYSTPMPHFLLIDGSPLQSLLMKNYPEFRCYRDIAFWWKYFLNTDRKIFPNYVNPDLAAEVAQLDRLQSQLTFNWDENRGGYQVIAYSRDLRCRPDPRQTDPITGKVIPPDQLPTHRYPSTATPSFYLPAPAIKTEDDVIYRPNLPTFEDKYGQVLNQRDSELMISYLTVPYMRLPLLITFFSSEDRIHKLQSKELRSILDSVMFEPGKHLRVEMSSVQPMMVPSPQSDLLSTPYGLLMNELCRSPDTVIRSILALLKGALACDTGSVVDEGATTFNTSSIIILYVARLGARVDNYISFIVDFTTKAHDCIDWPLREMGISNDTLDILKKGLSDVRELIHTQFNPLFEDYLKRLDIEISKNPNNEKTIDRNSRLACDLHAHKLLAYRNYHEVDFDPSIAKSLIGSFIYLTTRHTWNKTIVTGERLQVPETELYEILQISRRRVVNWLALSKQKVVDEVMQTALQVSSSLTGSLKVSADALDNQNRWSRISGERSVCRWAVGSTRTVASNPSDSNLADQFGSAKLRRQLSGDKEVGEVVDNGVLGVEIDYGLGQMTLRSKHLAALQHDIASHPDILHIFGDATIQASMIERATNMQKYRLVGLNHELAFWPTAHNVCPPLDDQWGRDYDPSDLFESEKWIASLFEPVRKSFFDGPRPPPMQFLMTENPTPADAEVIVMIGLHQTIGGPWKLIYLFRRLKTVHVYECLSQGREWWFSLHMTTDVRYTLHELDPISEDRQTQYPEFWIRGGGDPYPKGVQGYLVNDIENISPNAQNSVIIMREPQHHLNLSGGTETFVPKRLMYGIIPDALLNAYNFWKDESLVPSGIKPDDKSMPKMYKRLRGYPKEKDGEYMLLIEFFNHGSWESNFSTEFNNPNVIQITGFPGRSVRVTRKSKKAVEEEFRQRQRIASLLESMQLLIPYVKKKKEEKAKDDNNDFFKVDALVESDYEGKGQYWPCVVRRINDDGTYDLEYVDQYKYLGIQRNIPPELVQARGESEKKARGEGVWHWEGMSDSEDDDWREDSDDEENVDVDDDKHVKKRLDFFQFDNLSAVVAAAGGEEDSCSAILSRLGSVPGVLPFTDVFKLAKVVADTHSQMNSLGSANTNVSQKIVESEDLILVNVLYAPKRSRLHSILKVLSRIENASHICIWTKASSLSVNSYDYSKLEYGCPSLDLIELSRLKLSFTAREDHTGVLRLYSVDHVDLYISNESSTISSTMLSGIPHSLILSNVRGEMQVLVPVIAPFRPKISYEPFSTFIVLDRKELASSERFFLYPVHVSFSFLLTKGLNSAVYLMLLRFMHRMYNDVFRLADSIATDNKFNQDGLLIFKAFERCNDDWHPDAHACRLKIYLVTMDSGMKSPWDLTIECAKYSAKLDSTSSSCRLSLPEELQILESDVIVTSINDKKFQPEIHDEYSMALCFNRRSYLRSILRGEESSACKVPPRALSTNWPFYQDNTIFGQDYKSMKEIVSADEGDDSWDFEVKGGDETDAPTGGWLVVAVFHTLWSSGSIKVVAAMTELVAIYQDMVNFLSVRSDMTGLAEIAKLNNVKTFPTVILYRGGVEIDRVEGPERTVETFVRILTSNLTEEDKACRAKHRHRLRLEKALESGEEITEPVVEEAGEIDWTFDSEHCGSSYVIDNDGMRAVLAEEEEEEASPAVWQWKIKHSRGSDWTNFNPEITKQLETSLMTNLFANTYLYLSNYEIYTNSVVIKSYEIVGLTGTEYENYNSIDVRRLGDRVIAPNEEQHLSEEQKEIDRRNADRKKEMIEYKKKLKEQMRGKDIEIIRGSVGFLPNSGVHTWKFRWNHEPAYAGKGDAIGICSDYLEEFGPNAYPRLGGNDSGLSIGLHADGKLYYAGNLIGSIEGSRKIEETLPVTNPDSSEKTVDEDASTAESKSEEEKKFGDENPTGPLESSASNVSSSNDETKGEIEDGEKGSADTIVSEEAKMPDNTEIKEPMPIVKKELASLFGKDSIVGCELDTNDGGTLSFFVDSIKLEGLKVTDVFKKFGGNEVFPCVSITPIPLTVVVPEKKEDEAQVTENTPGKLIVEDDEGPEDAEEAEVPATNEAHPDPLPEGAEVDKYANVPSVTLIGHDEDVTDTATNEPESSASLDPSTIAKEAESVEAGESKVETTSAPEAEIAKVSADDAAPTDAIPDETIPTEEAKSSETEPQPVTDDSVKVLDVPLEKVRWMYEIDKSSWKVYTPELSKELEIASREGKSTYKIIIGEDEHEINFEKNTYGGTDDGSGNELRVRRHIVADGIQGLWEILSMKYEKPYGLSGQGILKILEKVWHNGENMSGQQCGLGFLFLYGLLSGDIRCKVMGGYGGYGGRGGTYGPSMPGMGSDDVGGYYGVYGKNIGSSSNDSHRFALLLTQLYNDKHTKSLPASVINILGRNRQVSLRMPKFKDSRKSDHSPFYNGWVDDTEPRSPIAELFGKLVPLMSTMKRKGAFLFPPPPPYPELPVPAPSIIITKSVKENFTFPTLSDYGCEKRVLSPIEPSVLKGFINEINYRLDTNMLKPALPLEVESSQHFDKIIKANPDRLIIVDCYASWCGPCKSLAPVFRQISLQTPIALFLKFDADDCDDLTERFKVESFPTIHFLRGGSSKEDIKGSIKGGGPQFIEEFMKLLTLHATDYEMQMLKKFHSKVFEDDSRTSDILSNLSINGEQLEILANQPLRAVDVFVTYETRSELGMPPVSDQLAFDVTQHEASKTAPAVSVLNRFKDDVQAYANVANYAPISKVKGISDTVVIDYFNGSLEAEKTLTQALEDVRNLKKSLESLRDSDSSMIRNAIPLVEEAVNLVDMKDDDPVHVLNEKTRFLLNRYACRNSNIWVEFIFGSLLSSKSFEDIRRLNPYISVATMELLFNLVSIIMLRANRLGHTNRCIGSVVGLESLLKKVLGIPQSQRSESGSTLIPKVIQACEDLSKTIVMGRYYVSNEEKSGYVYDPRFLVFEFVWSIQLRKKQVEIVNDFRDCLARGSSKVRQMIMGAGKTSVVAPLLALILADGKSLVLSVVPKALVEMSRTRLRETFASIMVKRIYTLDFDRSTVVKASMRRGLENAAVNRGVVVATPTTIKSVLLSYLEVLQRLKEAHSVGIKAKVDELKIQAEELSKILSLFKDGIMLLDEVDLILHPLKSELNFPIGEKFDLDGSEEGERWGLPIHLFDAIFFVSSGRVSSFEQRGAALDILKKISLAVQQGYLNRNLQRLPHVTLLNIEYYESVLKPLMAEWAYLWLQQQHLHGIDKAEAIQYILEGAAARSDISTKVNLLDMAITRVLQEKGTLSAEPLPTAGYIRTRTPEQRQDDDLESSRRRSRKIESLTENVNFNAFLDAQEKHFLQAKAVAEVHRDLVSEIYDIDDQLDEISRNNAKKAGELQGSIITIHKNIETIECPRDDSLDNSVVVWYCHSFASTSGNSTSSAGDTSVPTLCGLLEDSGLTIRRCAELEEAVSRARDLQIQGQLRCIIIGGDENKSGCGPACVKYHGNSKCLRCGKPGSHHFNGHDCPTGGRGSFKLKEVVGDESAVYLETMKSLTDPDTPYARRYKELPANRTAIYSAHTSVDEDNRMSFWLNGTSLFDDSKLLVKWVTNLPAWNTAASLTEEHVGDFAEKMATDKVKIDKLRGDVEALEAKKLSASEEFDELKRKLQQSSSDKNESLRKSVDERIAVLSDGESKMLELVNSVKSLFSDIAVDDFKGFMGPGNARDSAIALAWLETARNQLPSNLSDYSRDDVKIIFKHYNAINNELSFLRQMALAAKVVAHVTSPNHKKMLNLCFNWLSTFLPHCLAKVNRVSFGLLTVEDCKAALAADPHVPRSRLKLAVPFVGKDVPSKSSEFAHPDIVIGMSVLAYRYSGLRKDDFIDIIDSLTSEFIKEIGPARERKSSQRHEDWVFAAGGRIRGLKAHRDGSEWDVNENVLTEEELSKREVVQLKFLQKSNEEQMDKLFELVHYEPLVIHYYLQKTIFPTHMRSQRVKLSASGQAVGGDMIVGKRVGFSGTPSDLLPHELGRCDYETGDDGMMLTTCLDRKIASYEVLSDSWNVDNLLEAIAKAENPRFHALIDTGALITGYSNFEVAKQLLDRGLTWCDGVVFLDDDDKQQVLVRATGRVVSADQCGVSLEKRFAFYDQIHTTGMDIKHVVNAVAVITLGKDMVFRDYVQGAYRMRGIGAGQRIHVYIIPEVKELIGRELKNAVIPVASGNTDNVLECVVAWLVINSLRSEQTQWTMLCLQNISNLYRKNAYKCLHKKPGFFFNAECNKESQLSVQATSSSPDPSDLEVSEEQFIENIDPNTALKVFDESIDFSLEASVPDPVPFEKRLRSMLEENDALLRPEQHAIGHSIMIIVGQFSMIEASANRLDSEQEREQEQEQEKEVEARKDQQIEVEKFVDREYSRQEETQRPWPFSVLAKPFIPSDSHPFYYLKDFKLRHHDPLNFPEAVLLSNNYFNQTWKGLRRVKNVVMILEYAPSATTDKLRLKTPEEAMVKLTEIQETLLQKAHALLGFHANFEGRLDSLSRQDLINAIISATDKIPSDELIDRILSQYSQDGKYVTYQEFKLLVTSGLLYPEHVGRYWVAISLAEAETIRRILHVRSAKGLTELIPGCAAEMALRYSPLSGTTSQVSAGDGGMIFDASKKWYKEGTKATTYEAAVAHSCFRFYDCDMHFPSASLNILVRVLKGSPKERERFFLSTIGCKRRMDRKWQDTPLAKVFMTSDQWVALKQQAQSVYVNEALKAKNMTLWEAFTAIDSDNNGILSPSEVYGALVWLKLPNLTAEDVVDFIEAADKNRDGMLDYREYIDILTDTVDESTDQDDSENEDRVDGETVEKIEPYGADELREIMVARKQREQALLREERLRKQAYKEALDIKIFEEELEASRSRKGGANPLITTVEDSILLPSQPLLTTDYKFACNELPLRFAPTGKSHFMVLFQDTASDPKIKPMLCKKGHELSPYRYYWMKCEKCSASDTSFICWTCWTYFCNGCVESHRKSQEHDRRDVTKLPTCLRCPTASYFSLQIPSIGGANTVTGQYTLSMEIRMSKLPLSGQYQSLLRFMSSDSKKVNRASALLSNDGLVMSNITSLPTEDDVKTFPKIRSGVWFVVSLVVDPSTGSFKSFINGKKSFEQNNIDPSELRLHNKMVVFGGGTQAQCKGGDIRRLVIHDTILSDDAVTALYFQLGQENPAIGGKAVKIQAVYRGFMVRLKKKRDLEAASATAASVATEAAAPPAGVGMAPVADDDD